MINTLNYFECQDQTKALASDSQLNKTSTKPGVINVKHDGLYKYIHDGPLGSHHTNVVVFDMQAKYEH